MQRFWDKVEMIPFHECWEWIAGKTQSGYGRFKFNKKTRRAHRFSYELHFGPIPKGLIVCHRCDNTLCIRPEHLFLGTNLTNTRDMLKKGRAKFTGRPKSNKPHPKADIVKRLYKGPRLGPSMEKIAEQLGINEKTVRKILRHQ
jgi:hypothetical protein